MRLVQNFIVCQCFRRKFAQFSNECIPFFSNLGLCVKFSFRTVSPHTTVGYVYQMVIISSRPSCVDRYIRCWRKLGGIFNRNSMQRRTLVAEIDTLLGAHVAMKVVYLVLVSSSR